MSEIRGIIFDCDGVIADTARLHYESWKQLADEEGLPFGWADYLPMSGTKREENLRLFTQGLNLDDATKQEWLARKVRYYEERMNHLRPGDELPGIIRLLDDAQAAGIKTAVGSSSRSARMILTHLQLLDRFEAIGDGDSVMNSKPAPDIFLWVAGALGLPPPACLVIEDSSAGIQAALTGGFRVVGVGDGPIENAHVRLPHLAAMSLAELLNHVQKSRHNTRPG